VPFLNRIRSVALSPSMLVPLSVAAVTFFTAYDDGSYSLPSRNTFAIAVWWMVIVGIALRTFTLDGVNSASLAVGGLIAALCAWTFASVFWAPSAENAFNEFNRVSLFLGVFVVVTVAVRRASFNRWCDGLALGISLVTFIALISRFFPGSFSDQGLKKLHSVAHRLSFPLGYWNGLAIFVALGLPLLLRIAVSSKKPAVRALAVAPIPAIASVVFLASSRGGIITAFAGILVFFLLGERRWVAGAALLWGAAGSVAAIILLNSYNELVNGPLGTSLEKSEGRSAALFVPLFCALAGVGYAVGREAATRLAQKDDSRHMPWWLGRATVTLAVVIFLTGIAVSHPVRQFQAFKRPPATIPTSNFAAKHLRSGSGSGRWQFWTASIHQWENHPLLGNGAGSYEEWWTKHMPADYKQPVKDAHSLYIESLGELGVLGFALTLSLALVGIGIGVRRSRRSSGERRLTLATLTAVFAAFSVAAGIDWMWELTVVAGVGIVVLALLSSAAVTAPSPPQLVRADESRYMRQRRFGFVVASLVGVWILICAQGVPLLTQLRIKDSHDYSSSGKMAEAFRAAMDARNIQPWASSPYLQLALVTRDEGLYKQAHMWIERAISRDPTDWHLWFAASSIDTKLGNIRSAEQSLSRARSLNPRSQLFSG
jgi:O-antigen ligase